MINPKHWAIEFNELVAEVVAKVRAENHRFECFYCRDVFSEKDKIPVDVDCNDDLGRTVKIDLCWPCADEHMSHSIKPAQITIK